MIQDPQHQLRFGGLDLVNPADGLGYRVYALSSDDDTEWGDPEPVETVVSSFLQDGSLVSIDRFDNREIKIGLEVSADSSALLAEAEAAIVAETGKRNTLTWVPPDNGPATVFDVVDSYAEHAFSDLDELRLERRYVLTLHALPFPRSDVEVEVELVGQGGSSPTPTETVLWDSADQSMTGVTSWLGEDGDYSGPALEWGNNGRLASIWRPVYGEPVNSAVSMSWDPAPNIGLSGINLLRVDWAAWGLTSPGADFEMRIWTSSGDRVAPLVAQQVSHDGGVWSYFDISGASSLDKLTFTVGRTNTNSAPNRQHGMSIGDIVGFDVLPTSGSGAQQSRSLSVLGSARAQAWVELEVSDSADTLGDTIVYTAPGEGGLQPQMRDWRTAGQTPQTDSTSPSGWADPIGGATEQEYTIPASAFAEGTYALLAMIRGTAGQEQVTVAVDMGGMSDVITAFTNVDVTAGYQIHEIARLVLPPLALPPSDGGDSTVDVTIRMSAPGAASGSDVLLGEAWLFNMGTGSITRVDAGTAKVLRIDAPTLDRPRPALYLASQTDRSDIMHASGGQVEAWGAHQFTPGAMQVFTVTTNASAPLLTVRYHPRWFGHAGEVES